MSHRFWSLAAFRAAPAVHTGQAVMVILRVLYAAILLFAGAQKVWLGWLFSDTAQLEFINRLSLLEPGSIQAIYMENVVIPLAFPIAWFVTLTQLATGILLLIGVRERAVSLVTLFLYANFILGGYFFIQAVPILLMPFLFLVFPSGRWWGLEREDAPAV